jgi:ankyrin repeat protein
MYTLCRKGLFGKDSLNEGLLGACNGGHFEIVKLLVELGANNFAEALNVSRKGRTYEHKDITNFLLEQDPTACEDFEEQFCAAVKGECYDFIETMANKAISNAAIEWDNVLIQACYCKDTKIMKLLLEKATEDDYDPNYIMLLETLCKNNCAKRTELFMMIFEKVDVETRVNGLNNVFLEACTRNHTKLVRHLITNAVALDWSQGLYQAYISNNCVVFNMLVKNAPPGTTFNWSTHFTSVCCWSGSSQLVKHVLNNYDASVFAEQCFSDAMRRGNLAVVKLLCARYPNKKYVYNYESWHYNEYSIEFEDYIALSQKYNVDFTSVFRSKSFKGPYIDYVAKFRDILAVKMPDELAALCVDYLLPTEN